MYFWRADKLASDIRNKEVLESEWKNYYLAATIILILVAYALSFLPKADPVTATIQAVAIIVVSVWGIQLTYNSNGADGGDNYIARMVALSLPITIQLTVASLVLGLIQGFLIGFLGLAEELAKYFDITLNVLIQAVFFIMINLKIKYINT